MIADSGASLTFTHTKKDLQEFEKVDNNDFTVETASSNNPLKVKGVGCIFLEHDVQGTHSTKRVVTRLYPVYFIPGLSIRLLSIGQLLSQGLELWGNSSLLRFRKPNGRVILTCHPHQPGQTIFWLSGRLANDQSLLALSTVYSVDYDIMHRQFAHPSKDVLRQASGHTQNFPKLMIPTIQSVCSGCAEGKMTNGRSHHPTQGPQRCLIKYTWILSLSQYHPIISTTT